MVDQDSPRPPGPPRLKRAFRLYPWQWVGLPFLLLLPVTALFGLLGETSRTTFAEAPGLTARLQYPSRHRYRAVQSFDLEVRNTSPDPIATLTISLDPGYASRFLVSMAFPAFDDAYTIRLHDLPAGAARHVRVDLEGRSYGEHRGELVVTPNGQSPLVIPLRTFVFP